VFPSAADARKVATHSLIRGVSLKNFLSVALLAICLSLQACVGFIVGTAVDVAVEVAKVPFKVGGAIVDVATGNKDEKDKKGAN
jgi:hypothetical protein